MPTSVEMLPLIVNTCGDVYTLLRLILSIFGMLVAFQLLAADVLPSYELAVCCGPLSDCVSVSLGTSTAVQPTLGGASAVIWREPRKTSHQLQVYQEVR